MPYHLAMPASVAPGLARIKVYPAARPGGKVRGIPMESREVVETT